jgi:acetylornithine deacetylase
MHRADSITQSAVDLLQQLVGFNSVSALSNLPIIDYIEAYLCGFGVDCKRIPSPDGTKSNLLARIGPEVAGGIVLSGHTDVVPVVGQPWETDPFILTNKADILYGRGTADMKSFIAACLAMVPEFIKLSLTKPIYFAFSYDEEVGCLGAPYLLKYMVKHVPLPAFAIIGEPTMMQVVTAHKGVLSFETTVSGLEGHSSQPHLGVNAVQYACDIVSFLTGIATELSHSGMRDERFDPPHSTVHVGLINGGTARNIIPRECVFQWEIRPLPGDDFEAIITRYHNKICEVEAVMKKTYAQAEITTRPISRMSGVTLPAHASSACQMVMRCAQKNSEIAVSFGTEAGVFNDHGVPAIICGPGSIEQAHKPNEFIALSQIYACVVFMLQLTADDGLAT